MSHRSGLGVLDLLVAMALLALLVWLVRLDWERTPAPAPAPSAGRQP